MRSRPGRRRRPLHRVRRALVATALVATTLAVCPGVVVQGGSAGAQTPSPAGPLLVVDVEALSVEEQLTFAALQGIVNRDAPTLYLVGLRSAQDFALDPSAEVWLRDVVDLPTERVEPDEAWRRLLPRTRGLVVWDPAVPYESQDVATTIAGLEDLVPVSPATADRLTAGFGVEVRRDLRDLGLTSGYAFIEWAIDDLGPAGPFAFPVWTGRPRNGKPIQPGLRDWAVKNRGFVFDADPATEPALLRRVLAKFPPGTPVYGYPFFDTELYARLGLAINEAIAAALVADAGHWLVPTTDAANLSVHAQLGPATAKPKWDDTPRTPDADTTYVTFTISDGDAMGYDQTLLRHLHLDGLGPDTVPIGVSISPYLATDAPRIWDWLVTNVPDRVRFVAGPSGAGYAYPYAMADLDGYLDHSRAMLDRYGLRSTWILEPPLTPSPSLDVLQRFVARTDPSLLLTDYGGNPPEPPTVSFVDGVPVVHTVLVADSSADIAAIVRAVAATQPPGARFVSIGLTTWGTKVADAEAAMAALGDGFVAVAPDAFAGYLRGAHAAGYQGSGEPPRVPSAPAPGACRGTVTDFAGTGDPFARRFLARLLAAAPIGTGLRVESSAPGRATLSFDTDLMAESANQLASSNLALAYPPGTIETARISVALRDLTVEGTDLTSSTGVELASDAPRGRVPIELAGDGSVDGLGGLTVSATLEVTATFDPGDGDIEVSVSGPVACAPLATAAQAVSAPAAVPADASVTPTFTG
ncbi:MAG: GxGYxYP family putative glycoside hydrolase [Acidimicrobiales bacterium]